MKYANLVPELVCSDFKASLAFYTEVLGFTVVYARPEDRFAYLDREGAQVMLEQPVGRAFVNGELTRPYGRGVNFEIEVSDVEELYERVQAANAPVFLQIETKWYGRHGFEIGNRQFIVEDPDGYLLRFAQDLGERPAQGSPLA